MGFLVTDISSFVDAKLFLSSCHRIVLMDDAMDCLMSFSDFLFAFQIQFYYSGKCWEAPEFTHQYSITSLQLPKPCAFLKLVKIWFFTENIERMESTDERHH